MQNRPLRSIQCRLKMIRVTIRFPHTRLIYMIDEQKKLLGTITIGALIRHLYPYHYADKIHSRDILRNIGVEKTAHLMSRGNINASPEENVDMVLKRMASTGEKEIAVVVSDGYLLADITAVDLLSDFEFEL